MYKYSTLFIVNNIDNCIKEITSKLPLNSFRVIKNEENGKNDFLLSQSHKAIKESYIASSEPKYIILAGNFFRVEAQSALLKSLEEPPLNIIFILITTSKSSILPTILSRVQIRYNRIKEDNIKLELPINNLSLKDSYNFIKKNQRVSKDESKKIIKAILYDINRYNIQLTQKELKLFSNSMKLLELNSKPINVLTTILLSIILKNQ
ncbi:MAG: DNA polymerase III subunit delta' [Campylobacterota bacterium]|nr:DNA polymerase III subunit delta' [Campylobacterota bacterium]